MHLFIWVFILLCTKKGFLSVRPSLNLNNENVQVHKCKAFLKSSFKPLCWSRHCRWALFCFGFLFLLWICAKKFTSIHPDSPCEPSMDINRWLLHALAHTCPSPQPMLLTPLTILNNVQCYVFQTAWALMQGSKQNFFFTNWSSLCWEANSLG